MDKATDAERNLYKDIIVFDLLLNISGIFSSFEFKLDNLLSVGGGYHTNAGELSRM